MDIFIYKCVYNGKVFKYLCFIFTMSFFFLQFCNWMKGFVNTLEKFAKKLFNKKFTQN